MANGSNNSDDINAELAAQISELQQALAQRGRAIIRLQGETELAAKRCRELEQEKQLFVETVTNSLSWKLSSPIRWTGAAIRKAKLALSQLRAKTTREGGPEPPDETRNSNEVAPDDSPLTLPPESLSRTELLERAVQETLERVPAPGSTMDGYVHRVTDRVDPDKLDIKAIAFYMPHFYPDSEARGRPECGTTDGLDEWSRVAAARPRYLGHYQPRLPGDLGFYDLRVPDVLKHQAALARQYGIYGFCFHHYWDEGTSLFGLPLEQLLSDPDIDMPFCICWANGPWRQRWNVSAKSGGDDFAFLEFATRAFRDPRYIRIDGKPVLIVFAVNLLQDAAATAQHWRKRAAHTGFGGLYLIAAHSHHLAEPDSIGFDAILEYPPYEIRLSNIASKLSLIDAKFRGPIRSYSEIVEKQIRADEPARVNFKTVMPGWDDEPRNPGAGHCFAGSSPALYGRWLRHACEAIRPRRPDERLIFINAWNDWANGAYLEPDRRFGYAYLHATANVLRRFHSEPEKERLIAATNAAFTRRADAAIILHCHYEDLIGPVFERYFSRIDGMADVFVTTRHDFSRDGIEEIISRCPNVYIQCEENRGRDIRPFLIALRRVRTLGYKIACKVHTKKALHLGSSLGSEWRQRLMEPLLGAADSVPRVAQLFCAEPELGLLAPAGSVMDLQQTIANMLNTIWLDRLLKRMNRLDLVGNYAFHFPAGSMFWFRVAALDGLDEFVLAEDEFEPEYGQTDGTLAHAIERLFALYAEERGYHMKETDLR